VNTLVIFRSKNEYFFDCLDIDGVDVKSIYKETGVIANYLIKVIKKLRLPLVRYFYDDWYSKLGQYNKVIVFDAALLTDRSLLKSISEKVLTKELYLYSWNIVKNIKILKFEKKEAEKYGFTFYNYDKTSCNRYGLKHNTIMYDEKLKLKDTEKKFDILFLGFLKDRKEKMLAIYNAIIEAGLNPKFVIVGKKDKQPFEYKKTYVSYHKYLNMLGQTKAILDITQDGQDGFSLRIMEAIFFDKKLITTNKAIVKAEFYVPNNILFIDINNINPSKIKLFFKLKFKPYSKEIKKFYSFSEWLNRFQR